MKKLFKNRFGRQPIWWRILNLVRMILSIFFPSFRRDLYPNRYEQYKGDVGPLPPKKWEKHDIRKYTIPVLAWSLALMVFAANKALNFTEYDYGIDNNGGSSTTVVAAASPNSGETESESKFIVQQFTVEQIENLANTIAGQNAIWPGYKGDPKDNRGVQRHFNENFAKFINGGHINVQPYWSGRSVAFAYAVTDEGVLVFVGAIPGGSLTAEDNPDVYKDVSDGISGKIIVTPAQDEGGENIIMLYRIKVTFALQ